MLKIIPNILPDELVYSWLSRTYVRNGFCHYQGFAREVFLKPNTYVEYCFINELHPQFRKQVENIINFEELILEHSMFKYYSLFLPSLEKRKSFEFALNNKPKLNMQLPVPINKENYHLRFCPECVKEDRENFGECYFHSFHQIYENTVCPKHNCKLVDTNIPITKARDTKLVPLEQAISAQNLKTEYVDKGDINLQIAQYICEYLEKKFTTKQFPLGSFLTNVLDRRYFVGKRCEQKNIVLLLFELQEFYKDLNKYDITRYKLQNIFWNKYYNSWDIFLVSFFLGQTTTNLYSRENGLTGFTQAFDSKVVELYSKGNNYLKIARLLNTDKEVVRQIILGNYNKPKKHSQGGYSKKHNYSILEVNYLRKLPVIFKKYKGKVITKIIVAQELGIKDKTLRNYPKIREKIMINKRISSH